MANNDNQNDNDVKKLGELIKDIRIAMLTTVDENGSLHSRPMATQEAEFNGDLWFFTDSTTPKVREVAREHQVNISYAQPDDNRYISVSGTAEIVKDKAKMEELWNPALKAWFPKGLEDPNIVLLKTRVEKAEYWDFPSSTLVQLVGFFKAIATGKSYDGGGDNEKIELDDTPAADAR